jgi:hypothetical protein
MATIGSLDDFTIAEVLQMVGPRGGLLRFSSNAVTPLEMEVSGGKLCGVRSGDTVIEELSSVFQLLNTLSSQNGALFEFLEDPSRPVQGRLAIPLSQFSDNLRAAPAAAMAPALPPRQTSQLPISPSIVPGLEPVAQPISVPDPAPAPQVLEPVAHTPPEPLPPQPPSMPQPEAAPPQLPVNPGFTVTPKPTGAPLSPNAPTALTGLKKKTPRLLPHYNPEYANHVFVLAEEPKTWLEQDLQRFYDEARPKLLRSVTLKDLSLHLLVEEIIVYSKLQKLVTLGIVKEAKKADEVAGLGRPAPKLMRHTQRVQLPPES